MRPAGFSKSRSASGSKVAPAVLGSKTHLDATHDCGGPGPLADTRSTSKETHSRSLLLPSEPPSLASPAPSPTGSYRQRKPRHVPIVITQSVIDSVLKDLPDSADSGEGGRASKSPSCGGARANNRSLGLGSIGRSRHTPIVIPAFAHPFGVFQPTPANSTEGTPKISPPSPSSPSSVVQAMSRPTTSGSRTSTLDSNASMASPDQTYAGHFQPSSSTYLGDQNSSGSSLNQPDFNELQDQDLNQRPARAGDQSSPAVVQQSQTNGASTTNLSGLVCNVHKCSGKEPHALVGATTTILGDKLYVFGGRVLSRRRPPLTSDMYELDLIRRHWTKVETTGDIPAPRYFHSVCALGDTKLICYGGMSPVTTSPQPNAPSSNTLDPQPEVVVMSDIHIYDAPTRTWTHVVTTDTPQGRYAHCAAVLPSSAVFTSANAPLSAIHHNPSSANPHQGTLGVNLDGTGGAEMVVVGGQDSANHYIEQISVFNLRSLKWTATRALGRSCGAYRSVVAPLTSMPASKIGLNEADNFEDETSDANPATGGSSMLIYSNYNFLDVKLELQVRLADGSLVEKTMNCQHSPPGLRFPNGGVLDNHFVVSGTYLTSSKQEYALWALDLKTLTWSRIDAGGNVFGHGSWNRGVLWSRRNTFVILGNRKRSLVEDYNHRRINFANICMVELEAFGLYDNPRRAWPTSAYPSISAPVLPPALALKHPISGGRPYSNAAINLGQMALTFREFADMDLIAIGGERIPVNSHLLARRWGPYFIHLLRESSHNASSTAASTYQTDSNSSNSGTNTLRPAMSSAGQSTASRNSSVTITPSVTTSQHSAGTNSTIIGQYSLMNNVSIESLTLDPPSAFNLSPLSRPRQLYLPHTVLTIKALVHYLYTSSLPPATHHLCTPQILCSLIQLARPYRIDGILEAVIERLHQVLDGRNAAAVFNAAAMAAGGGRGIGSLFGAEGVDSSEPNHAPHRLDETNLGAVNGHHSQNAAANTSYVTDRAPPGTARPVTAESDDGTSSEVSGSTSMESSAADGTSGSESEFSSVGGTANGRVRKGEGVIADGEGEIWSGELSCVVGLQKRGLRGLMEGRRMRERGRGGATGGSLGGGGGGGTSNGFGGVVGLGVS